MYKLLKELIKENIILLLGEKTKGKISRKGTLVACVRVMKVKLG